MKVDLKYEGGCHKGELTLIGQQQARGGWGWGWAGPAGGAGAGAGSRAGRRPLQRPRFGRAPVPALTTTGAINPFLLPQQQALDFGRWLRWRYAMVHPLLPDAWEPGAVAARSTNYQRTLATLQVG